MGNPKNALGNNRYFDPKMGLAGALVMGTIVFFINWDHGIGQGLIAASKQSVYTFLAGGTMMRITENIASHYRQQFIALFLAVLTPTVIAVILTYLVHSMKGTPEPVNSTIPTLLLAPWGFLWWAIRKRKQADGLREESDLPWTCIPVSPLILLSLPPQSNLYESFQDKGKVRTQSDRTSPHRRRADRAV